MGDVKIPGFEVLEKLGEGGLGAVYKARQLSLDRLVAIKTLPPECASDPSYIEQFQLEARTAATLKHPNIVQIHEAGEHEGLYFFVMEFVSGYSVASWLQRKRKLSETDALLVSGYIAEALEYGWNKAKIIHGDIKPDNMMVDEDGTIKLADYLAVARSGSNVQSGEDDTVIGTPNFMSPEQVLGSEKMDFRTDIYALGAVLYQLTTGILPFQDAANGEEVLDRQLSDNIADPQELNPEVSDGLAWLIEKMMVKDPEFRYGGWGEVRMDIARVQNGQLPMEPLPTEGTSTVRRCANRKIPPTVTPKVVDTEPPPPPATPTFAPRKAPPFANQPEPLPTGEKWLYVLVSIVVLAVGTWVLFLGKPPVEDSEFEPIDTVEVPVEPEPEPVVVIEPLPEPVSVPLAQPVDPVVSLVEEAVVAASVAEIVQDPVPLPVEEKVVDPSELSGFLEYCSVMERVMKLCSMRRYDQASRLLSTWLEGNSSKPFADRIGVELDRVSRLQELFLVFERNIGALRGTPVRAKPRLSGKVERITGDRLTLVRETSGVAAQFDVSLMQVYERDLADLFKCADPEGYQLNLVRYRTGRMKFEEAREMLQQAQGTPDSILYLQTWIDDWESAVFNIRANEAVDDVAELVESLQLIRAQAKLASAETHYGFTDIFDWVREQEIDELRMAIENGLSTVAAVEPSIQTIQPDPAETETLWPLEGVETTEEVMEPLSMDQKAEQISVQELTEKLISYDKQLVKLSFHARGDIRQTSEAVYATQVGSHGIFFPVEFSQDGFKWIKGLPKWSGKRRRTVYGVVDADYRKVALIGRTKKTPIGGKSVEYSW